MTELEKMISKGILTETEFVQAKVEFANGKLPETSEFYKML